MTISQYLTGICIACDRRFRWETESRLRVQDAICLGCDGPLTRTRSGSSAAIEHVDADWVRPKQTTIDPQEPSTWVT